ncbi:efflux RND transporter periplasmic adaptor subunit [Chelatococcus reniformis]|uniref:Hemolysin secretion protein D n=1 Tax=Chelatococcus reniformis TaxID=1494448 RepID=A0A916TXX6_9HYPH|nr:efflux RND transporter periplasmic adaptor subunit [Chelatococcus reniformis]GGC48514.1 hemolysin secretion protein D [Chelatococcus reniformis]
MRQARRSKRASVFARGLVALCLVALCQVTLAAGAAAQAPVAPPAVTVATIRSQDVTNRVNFIGSIEAMQKVDLRARVEGFLDKVAFQEGATLPANAPAYVIEQAPYIDAVNQAKATLAEGDAQLASAEASLKDKQATYGRQSRLATQQFASQAALDEALAARDQAAAAVEQAKAQIASANAALATANLNLSYTNIATPIAGRIGKTAITQGNLVSPATGVLATVVQMSPIRVVFAIPERDYVTIMRFLATPAAKSAPGMDDLFKPQLILPDGSTYGESGRIEFINNQIDASTGTVAVRAVFDNPERLLLPGQYVSVTVQTGQKARAVIVPQVAVQRNAAGAYVLLVDKDSRVQVRPIVLGETAPSGFVVTSGLQEGEQVIVDGVQKVRPGAVVHATTAPAPSGSAR